MTCTNRVVFVATSAAPGRDYRGEFLNAFAYPSGHHVFFRYRAKWITQEFRHDLESLKTVRCILVFCDPANADEFRFYPVRHCKIVDVDVPRPGAVLHDDEQVALRLELGDFVHPDMSSTQDFASLINSDGERPYPLGSTHAHSSRFVFARDALATLNLDANDEWFRTADRLSTAQTLKDAVLMHIRRISEVRDATRWKAAEHKPVEAIAGGYGLVYELRHDRPYLLELEYAPGKADDLSRPEVAPPALAISMPVRRVYPQYVSTSLLLAPIGITDSRCGLLISPNLLSPGPEDNRPRAVLLLKVKGARPNTLLHTAVIGTGLFFQNFAEPVQQQLITALHVAPGGATAAVMVTGIKIAGLFIALLGVLFGLKQLPNLPGQS